MNEKRGGGGGSFSTPRPEKTVLSNLFTQELFSNLNPALK